ncbi:PQQ-binding-like beta-propeller repeat protein [Verrucomicrobiaceae bacterium 227]
MKILILALLSASPALATDWPQWRGPEVNNHAAASAKPVTEWSADKNVRWKTPIPGRGHSTPIVVGDRLYLTTSEKEKSTQSLLALDRKSGKVIWNKIIHKGGFPVNLHKENSAASQTAQWDGSNILVVFENDKKIKTTAVTPKGEIVWTKTVGDYLPSFHFGYGSTPVLYNKDLIVVVGTIEGGFITSLNTADGNESWRIKRNGHDYWATPVVAKIAGKEQLLISGTGKISSYDPSNGKLFWEAPLAPQSTCGTVVWTDDMVFGSGGYPKNETAGIMADGSKKVVWRNRERCYEQSLLSYRDHIYAITDKGFAHCWDAKTGEEKWRERVGRGGVMASPLAVGDHIYATLKDGSTVIFKAGPAGYQEVAKNQLGDDTYATPVAVDNELFLRVGFVERGNRQEVLYSLVDSSN